MIKTVDSVTKVNRECGAHKILHEKYQILKN